MRLRKKRNLEQRIEKVSAVLAAREGKDFYTTPEEERKNILSFRQLFGNDDPVHLEIGCGKGGFIVETAKRLPDVHFLAAEILSNVIVEGCEKAVAEHLSNLYFLNCSAENLLYFLPPRSVKKIYLNFSCPYPKKSYANKRLTHPKFLQLYGQLLTTDGEIRLKTDDVPFFEYSLDTLRQKFIVEKCTYDLYAEEYVGENVATEYEKRFLSQHMKICFLQAKMPDF